MTEQPDRGAPSASEYRAATTPITRDVQPPDAFRSGAREIWKEYAGQPEFTHRAHYWRRQLSLLREAERIGDITQAQTDAALAAIIVERELQAATDPLTQLLNRRSFTSNAETSLSHLSRMKEPASIAIVDIDLFKGINDRYGHDAGDAVLQQLAGYLNTASREQDIVGRWGGEEFVLLLPGTNVEQAVAALERLRIEGPNIVGEAVAAMEFAIEQPVTMSIGVASTSIGIGYNLDELVRSADEALYIAKEQGRNKTVAYSPSDK